jgi:hypothetical protein
MVSLSYGQASLRGRCHAALSAHTQPAQKGKPPKNRQAEMPGSPHGGVDDTGSLVQFGVKFL